MDKYFTVLEGCPLFAGIQRQELRALLDCLGARRTEARKGQAILREGEPARFVGLVLDGTVQIEKVDYYGNRSILTQALPGELFGESFACAGAAEMPVSAVATEDSTVMLIERTRITTGCSNACSTAAAWNGSLPRG